MRYRASASPGEEPPPHEHARRCPTRDNSHARQQDCWSDRFFSRSECWGWSNPRTAPSSWPGDTGYVGGIADSGTGLEDLGAREYDAQTGRFVSLDPLLESSDPSQISGYDYSGNDPVTGSDPTGASWFSSLSNAVSGFARTAGQVMQRTN